MYDTLVIGGSGFLGHHLCEALEAKKHSVLIIDDQRASDPLGLRPHANGLNVIPISYEKCARGTIVNAPSIKTVYLLAATSLRKHLVGACADAIRADLLGVAELLDTMVQMKWQGRLVFVSSSEVYGNAPCPQKDDGPFAPITPYAVSKLAAERMVQYAAKHNGLDALIVRPFNLYGPYAHYEEKCGEVIPRFMVYAQLGCHLCVYGAAERDFLWVKDAVDGIMLAAKSGERGKAYSLATGEAVSTYALAEKIGSFADNIIEIDIITPRLADTPALCGEAGRAIDDLDWEPTVSLDEGLQKLWGWHTDLGEETLKKMAMHIPVRAY